MVAEIEPVPETPKDAPVPTTIAAVVFVLLVSAEKADEPPLPPEAAPCPGVSVCACASSDANRSAMTQLKFRLTAASAIH